VETWYIPGKSPIRVSQLHRAVAMNAMTGRPECPPYSPETTRLEVFEFWSSDMLKLFREAGVPRRTPPPLPNCAAEESGDIPRILSPRLNISYTLQRSRPERVIALEAGTAADVRNVFWFDGSALIGRWPAGAGAFAWRPASEGEHLIRVIDDHGRAAEREIQVQVAP
jgi:penicillin-binding protein 1C